MTEPAAESAKRLRAPRLRAPLWGDLCIVVLGVWGFIRQCLWSLGQTVKGPHELPAKR